MFSYHSNSLAALTGRLDGVLDEVDDQSNDDVMALLENRAITEGTKVTTVYSLSKTFYKFCFLDKWCFYFASTSTILIFPFFLLSDFFL